MSDLLDSVNRRTQLVGQNRLELLTFRLMRNQCYGINVFKVKEVLQCPKLTHLPNLHPLVKGIVYIRGKSISVIDMSLSMGQAPITEPDKCFVIISEYNRSIQGFLVKSVERIVNLNWEAIQPASPYLGQSNYLTGVTEIDGEIVEILDVERVLNEISPIKIRLSKSVLEKRVAVSSTKGKKLNIMVVDDSLVARNQIKNSIEMLGYNVILATDGRNALEKLQHYTELGDIKDQVCMVISDIEMPEMDGYRLTKKIKENPKLSSIYVILHSSLSGSFNEGMVSSVNADAFIPKFDPNDLCNAVVGLINMSQQSEE